MNIIVRNIPREEVRQLINEIVLANVSSDSVLNKLKNHILDSKEWESPSFERHYTVGASEDVHELEARAKYVAQSIKIIDESLTQMLDIMERLHDNVCSSSESTQA